MTTKHGLPTIFCATAATLLLAACGGGASAGDDLSSESSREDKEQAFFSCLRKAGVEVNARTVDGGRGKNVEIRVPRGVSKTRMGTIEKDCAKKTGGGPGRGEPMTKAEQAKFLDQALKFSRCMRAQGINMPDPVASGGGIRVGGPGKDGIDPESPAFQRAQKECASFMPGKFGLKAKGGGGPKDGGPSVSSSAKPAE
jgi:hypothetical protein